MINGAWGEHMCAEHTGGGVKGCRNHPSHSEFVSKTVPLYQSLVRRKALRKLNAFRALPVYPILEDKKSDKGSNAKLLQRKTALKRLHG